MLSIIAALAENNVIGKNNSLIWSLPEDLKRFQEITSTKSKTIIMGRKTFESLGKILPGRKHIVMSGNNCYNVNNDCVQTYHSVEDLKSIIESPDEYFVIGGGEIFSLLIPYVKRMYLTIVHESFEGDTFFPDFNKNEWKIVYSTIKAGNGLNNYETTFMILEKLDDFYGR